MNVKTMKQISKRSRIIGKTKQAMVLIRVENPRGRPINRTRSNDLFYLLMIIFTVQCNGKSTFSRVVRFFNALPARHMRLQV